jgi:hypothetical protein
MVLGGEKDDGTKSYGAGWRPSAISHGIPKFFRPFGSISNLLQSSFTSSQLDQLVLSLLSSPLPSISSNHTKTFCSSPAVIAIGSLFPLRCLMDFPIQIHYPHPKRSLVTRYLNSCSPRSAFAFDVAVPVV